MLVVIIGTAVATIVIIVYRNCGTVRLLLLMASAWVVDRAPGSNSVDIRWFIIIVHTPSDVRVIVATLLGDRSHLLLTVLLCGDVSLLRGISRGMVAGSSGGDTAVGVGLDCLPRGSKDVLIAVLLLYLHSSKLGRETIVLILQ